MRASRWRAFGWHTISIEGHDLKQVLAALGEARRTGGKPTMIIARTLKGKGVALFEGKDNWHGKPLKKGAETDQAIAELEAQYVQTDPAPVIPKPARRQSEGPLPDFVKAMPAPAYKLGDSVATREAYGTALAALGAIDRRVVALDADVKNSTFSERFEKVHPDRFYQMFIAEQVMVGAAMGLAARGAVPFPSSFACFLERASDFVRMAGISNLNVKLAGSHAGVSIGEDGPSQMALEDLAMARGLPNCTVLYPCDAVSAERLMAVAASTPGPVYLRLSRPKTPVIYGPNETFAPGGSKTLRQSASDAVTVVGAGVTVFEALKAHDALAAQGIVDPRDRCVLGAAGGSRGAHLPRPRHRRAHDHRRGSLRDRWSRRCGLRSRGTRASACSASPCARSRAADRRTSCSIATASRPRASPTPCTRRRGAGR